MAVAEMGQASSTDFRSAAVEASRHVLSAGRITDPDRADLSKLGASLCVPAPGDPAQFRRSLGMRMILVAVLGVGGVFAGWLILKYFGGGDAPNEPMRPMGWVGAGVSVFGMLSLLSALGVQRRAIARHLERNAALRGGAPPGDRVIVSIEDPQSFHTLKLVTEDVAEVTIDPARRLAVVEGYSHRYVVRGEDVVDCYQAEGPSETGVVIVYRIGKSAVTLSLVLVYNNLLIAFRKKLHLLGRNPLATKLEQGLGIQLRT